MKHIYPVNEIFQSIQGEATFTGTPSIFVRLQGCPVGCAWCDTKHTWEIDPKFVVNKTIMLAKEKDTDEYADMSVMALLETLKQYHATHVVITGGEPCIHDLTPLTSHLYQAGYTTQIETSGTHEIKCHPSAFITVSPKLDMAGGFKILPECLEMADEIKHPVGKQADIDKLMAEILPYTIISNIWLQPLSQSQKATDLCIQQATENGWKVSIQTHKFLGVR